MSELLATIRTKIEDHNLNEIVSLMGYQKTTRALGRLDSLLSATNLLSWFNQGSYDFKYSNREFVLKLGKILDIPQSELISGITMVNNEQARIEKMFQPYVYIDTRFKRQNQPIFILAIFEARRHIRISKNLVLRNKTAELQRIKQIVVQHYEECSGQLEIWGKIHQYIYFFDEGQKIAILPNGKTIQPDEDQQQKAALTLNGRDVCPLLLPD